MKQTIIIFGAFVALLALPLSTFAATYGYISLNNCLDTEQAIDPTQALMLPANIDPQSGVILFSNSSPIGNFASYECQ